MLVYYALTGSILTAGLLAFALGAIREHERLAARRALYASAAVAAGWMLFGVLFPHLTCLMTVITWFGIPGMLGLLAIPAGKPEPLEVNQAHLERFDERHVIFGRMQLQKDTANYCTYYGELNPRGKKNDDHLRKLPGLGEPGGKYAHPLDSPYADALFGFIEDFRHLAEPEVKNSEAVTMSPQEATRRIKGFALYLGALDVRITRLKNHHVYSHAGRHQHNWGTGQDPSHKYAIVVSVEMDHAMTHSAPLSTEMTEASFQYMRAANIAIVLSYYIARLGYPTRAHVDGNYQVLCTALAHDAGIGELGRLGLIITPTHGPRVRLAAVTTDLPLIEDAPINFGVQHFCRICKKCADNCPSGSIERHDKQIVRGVSKWQSNMETCFRFWLKSGTDCGVCMAVCPYSKPDTILHRMVRFFTAKNALARHLALFFDDLFYSRHPRHTHKPAWFTPHDSSITADKTGG